MFKCNICSGTKSLELLKICEPDRFERSVGIAATDYERFWIDCQTCGIATNILPLQSEEKLEAVRSSYYEVDFANSNIGEKYQFVMGLPAHKSDNAQRVQRIIEFVEYWFGSDDDLSVLDIGAGTGVFLSRFVERAEGKPQCTALEPDPIAAEHLRGLKQFDVIEDMFLGQDTLKGFGLITLNKVLEHIADPVSFLKMVSSAMNQKNSAIYIEVPDKITTGLRPSNDNILGALHCHLYDPKGLAHVINSAGLDVIRLERVFEPSGKITVFGYATLPNVLHKKGKL